eukprot:749264-Hanusia_phi.AAC.2
MATWAQRLRAGKEEERETEAEGGADRGTDAQTTCEVKAANEDRSETVASSAANETEAGCSESADAGSRVKVPAGKKVVLDSGMLIKGERIDKLGENFWTVREVDPSSLAFVSKFSKLTGDFNRLSNTDLKVMALTYQLEKEFYGTAHLNDAPKPMKLVNPEKEENKAAESENVTEDITNSETTNGAGAENGEGSAESNAGHKQGNKKQAPSLPGWYEGTNDDEGWITPENVASFSVNGKCVEDDSDANVACATLDGAMQNVLLQIGLRVVNGEGLVVKNVKQFVQKCHACFKICHDNTKMFCPSCGNATLMRVSMWVQADGRVTYRVARHLPYSGLALSHCKTNAHTPTHCILALSVRDFSLEPHELRLYAKLISSAHRQRRPKTVVDDEGFTTLAPRDKYRARNNQEILGMGYGGGGKRNPNERRRG